MKYLTYAGTVLTLSASAVLSVALFISYAQGLAATLIYGVMALGMEIAKIVNFHNKDECRKSAAAFYFLLVLSLAASVASLVATASIHNSSERASESVLDAYNAQIESYDSQIASKNVLLATYIKHEKITLHARPLQEEIADLQNKRAAVKQLMSNVPHETVTPMLAMANSFSSMFNIDVKDVVTTFAIVFALALEISALSLVSHLPRASTPETIDETISETPPPSRPKIKPELTLVETSPYNVQEVTEAIVDGDIPVSVRGAQRALGLNSHQAVALFADLKDAGIVAKQKNGRYKLVQVA